jgi:type II secretory pathway component GspD/PulD (secretin)
MLTRTQGSERIMKTSLLLASLTVLIAVASNVFAQAPPAAKPPSNTAEARTLSSFDLPDANEERIPRAAIKFESIDVGEVLKLYQEISGRSIIRAATVPNAAVSFVNQTPLTRTEALQALDNVLAAQGITMIYLGTKYVKAVPAKEAPGEAGPVIELAPEHLPESSSYLTYIVPLKNRTPEEAVIGLQPFAKMPNSIIATRGSDVIILRDYSINVRRMLQVLERIEQPPRTPEKKPQPAAGKSNQ